MKKLNLLGLMMVFFVGVCGQTSHTDGQTTLINPNGRTLLIERDNEDSWLTFHDPENSYYSFGIDHSNNQYLTLNYGGTLGHNSHFVMSKQGNFGIGTATVYSDVRLKIQSSNPSTTALRAIGKLDIWGNQLNTGDVLATIRGFNSTVNPDAYLLKIGVAGASNWEKFVIKGNGNVGVGTNSPKSKLHIKSSGDNLNILRLENATWQCNQETAIEFWNGTHKGVTTSRIVSKMNNCGDGGENLLFQTQSPTSANPNTTVPTTKLFIKADGNVGIGTTTPDAKLHVSGDILADEIRVEDIAANNLNLTGDLAANNITVKANGNTADFVFEDSYQLKDLAEVETFIKANKHLPDIPSAAQMEEQGVNLAEMNKLLLQKVEELTLYSIELEKARKQEKVEREQLQKALSKEQGARNIMEKRSTNLEKRLLKLEELLLKDDKE